MFDSLFAEGGLSLERLKVLIEVHDAGSIARAAPGDPVRHSQYSRQLRELSQFFGCEVAQRRGKLVKLTVEGTRLAELARQFLRGLEDFHAECRSERVVYNIAAGDSLIQWLVIPRLGAMLTSLPDVRFATLNLRTDEIVQQVADSRVDFGLVRKNAVVAGMKSASLGTLSYVAVVPEELITRKKPPTFSEVLRAFPLALQTTDGQFTNRLREIALAAGGTFRPGLACQSFPQVFAAVKSGRFAAILPEIAARDLPPRSCHKIYGDPLLQLRREITLVWNPRVISVRPHAASIVAKIQAALRF